MRSANLKEIISFPNDMDNDDVLSYESHLANRKIENMRDYEFTSLKVFWGHISNSLNFDEMNGFYLSYIIPQIGKEFDLLKITKSKVINIELKSELTTLDDITKQLLKNRYYLSVVCCNKCSLYTYVSSKSVLYKLSGDVLEEATIESLINEIKNSTDYLDEETNIDSLFTASKFLVSPINNQKEFCENKYFLTQGQEQIEDNIICKIKNKQQNKSLFFKIKGSAGTGKTLLIYDLAKKECKLHNICIVHCGVLGGRYSYIFNSYNNIKIISVKYVMSTNFSGFDILMIDESQRIHADQLSNLIECTEKESKICIFSIDPRQTLSTNENGKIIDASIDAIREITKFELSNKIRTNDVFFKFIEVLFNLNLPINQYDGEHVKFLYANDNTQANIVIEEYENKGYTFIGYTKSFYCPSLLDDYSQTNNTHKVIGQEFDNVIMILDSFFYYNKSKKLCSNTHPCPRYQLINMLYQGLTRAKTNVCLVIVNNECLFKNLIEKF